MFWYNFDTVLCQFLQTGTSDKCVICIVQNLKFSCFILYPPFIFFTVPLSMYGKGREDRVYIHYSVTCFTHRSFYCKQVTVTRQEQCRRHRLQSLLLLFLELVHIKSKIHHFFTQTLPKYPPYLQQCTYRVNLTG